MPKNAKHGISMYSMARLSLYLTTSPQLVYGVQSFTLHDAGNPPSVIYIIVHGAILNLEHRFFLPPWLSSFDLVPLVVYEPLLPFSSFLLVA